MTSGRARTGPTLSFVVGAVVATAGWMIGLSGLSDNSFLTHLATGRLIWDTHHIPMSDPYTFTAAGRSWVVQSWLASVLYGGVDRLGGPGAVLVVVGAIVALVATLVWLLTAPAVGLIPRLAVMVLAIAIGTAYWSERPLTLGLVALSATLLCAEGRLGPRWLVPIFWVWANVHGSFPLGVIALLALAVGRRFDGERPTVELDALKWAVIGCVVACVNPLGPRLLVFPLELLSKQDILRHVVEWQAPAFTSPADRAYILLLLVAVASLMRRPSWRAALPLMVFLPLSLISSRNVVVASIVLVPGTCAGLSGLGSLTGDERRSPFRLAVAALAGVATLAGVSAAHNRPLDLRSYPVAAVDYARQAGLFEGDHRIATQDIVGNYLDLVEGPTRRVYVDDRYDMLPRALLLDYVVLLGGKPGWESALDRYRIDVVVWEADLPLAELLRESSGWRIVYRDRTYIVARRL